MQKWKEGDVVVFREKRRSSPWRSSVLIVTSIIKCKVMNCVPLKEGLGTAGKCPKIILRLVPANSRSRQLPLGFCPFRVSKVKAPETSLGVAGFIFNGV